MQFVLKNILIKKVKISLFENKISSFRGVAQLVARVVWEHRFPIQSLKRKTAENPLTVRISGTL